jgi:hypothetical protein
MKTLCHATHPNSGWINSPSDARLWMMMSSRTPLKGDELACSVLSVLSIRPHPSIDTLHGTGSRHGPVTTVPAKHLVEFALIEPWKIVKTNVKKKKKNLERVRACGVQFLKKKFQRKKLGQFWMSRGVARVPCLPLLVRLLARISQSKRFHSGRRSRCPPRALLLTDVSHP